MLFMAFLWQQCRPAGTRILAELCSNRQQYCVACFLRYVDTRSGYPVWCKSKAAFDEQHCQVSDCAVHVQWLRHPRCSH